MAILRRTERAMCGVKLIMEKKRTEDLMVMLGLKGNSGSDGNGEWSKMVRACVGEGRWACFEKSIEV